MADSELADFGLGKEKAPVQDHIRVTGVISRLSEYPEKEGKSAKYYLWIHGLEKCYSGFNRCPAGEGDTIEFEYDETESQGKIYNNIKKIIGVKSTHTEPTERDQKAYDNEEMRIAVSKIVGLAIQYWMQRNLPDKELQIVMERFLKLAMLWEDYKSLNDKVITK